MMTVLSVFSTLQQFAGVTLFQSEEIVKGSHKENSLFLGTE
jgi:hypothetical protein